MNWRILGATTMFTASSILTFAAVATAVDGEPVPNDPGGVPACPTTPPSQTTNPPVTTATSPPPTGTAPGQSTTVPSGGGTTLPGSIPTTTVCNCP